MKLSELIEQLGELQEEHGDDFDPEVLAAYQQNCPLAGTVDGAVMLESDGDESTETQAPQVVWIALVGHPRERSP